MKSFFKFLFRSSIALTQSSDSLAAYINSIRAMMCIAMLLSFVACIIILFGMECSQLLGEKVGLKQKLMRISAVLFCITGT